MSARLRFLSLPPERRALAFGQTAAALAASGVMIEKDFWGCWLLALRFADAKIAPHLVFKGGTSLSKAAWDALTPQAVADLTAPATGMASLPSELPAEDEEARRFDLLLLRTQLAVLHADPGFERLRRQVQEIAGLLADQAAIPMVKREMLRIEAMQGDPWWQDVSVAMLEVARRRLRALVKLIERRAREGVYSDFEDGIGAATPGAARRGDAGRDGLGGFAPRPARSCVSIRIDWRCTNCGATSR